MRTSEEINELKPIKAYAEGHKDGWNEVCKNFWTIIETMQGQGLLTETMVNRFRCLGTLPK